MARARSNDTTSLPCDASRRGFLARAAGVAAGGAALIGAAAMAGAAGASPGAPNDAALLQFEEEIFDAYHAATSSNEEIKRLQDIWHAEGDRLLADMEAGRSDLTAEQRLDLVSAMPEYQECDRLITISEAHYQRMFDLVDKMWATPARTDAGRKAKAVVLLGCVIRDDWNRVDAETDYDILMARHLLIEFVGGEPAAQLRDQFA